MTPLIKSISDEYRRYKNMAEGALAQVPEDLLSTPGPGNGNSLAVICWHIAGNFQSRFSDFLISDGEKPWRDREEEFAARSISRRELMEKWALGWRTVLSAIDALTDDDLFKTVTIRQQPLSVHEALHRSLAHVSYHVGQIVYVAHYFCGAEWKYLTIPPGQSAAYNLAPKFDKPTAHAEHVKGISRG
ncbi:MAG: DUF1572 family protein [Gemmatimonas sp.]